MSAWIEIQNGSLVNLDRMCAIQLHQGPESDWRVEAWNEHQDGTLVFYSSPNKDEAQRYLLAVRTVLGVRTVISPGLKREAFVSARITFETALEALGNMAEQGRKGEFCQRHIEELSRISNVIAREL